MNKITHFAEELKEAIQNGASTSDIIQLLEDWYKEKQKEELPQTSNKSRFKRFTIGELRELLQGQSSDKVCKFGFGYPHAHRGYYNHVSFPPNEQNITIGQLLDYLKDAVNHEFEGWKGGEYRYDDFTLVHFNFEGRCSDDDCYIPEHILKSILG